MTPIRNVYFLPSGALRPRAEREALFREIEQREMMQRAEKRRAAREEADSPTNNPWANRVQQLEQEADNAFRPGEREATLRRLETARKESAKRDAEIAANQLREAQEAHPLIVEIRGMLGKHRQTLGEDRSLQIEAAILANLSDPGTAHSEAAILILDGLKARHQERVAAQREAHSVVLRAQADAANADVSTTQAERDLATLGGDINGHS